MTRRRPSLWAIIGLLLVILLLGVGLRLAFLQYYRAAYPVFYRETVIAEAGAQNLPPELVFAVIRCESGFDHMAVSHVEARGLMQITQDTYEWARWRMGDDSLHFDEMFTPQTNIKYGAAILRLLLDEFGGAGEAVAAYHAGWGSVHGWLEDEALSANGQSLDHIPFPTTRTYVEKVLQTQKIYAALYDFPP